MNRLALTLSLSLALPWLVGDVGAQDSELGSLPPLPNLDMGDPERKLSWAEKRRANKAEEERRARETSYTRTPSDTGSATLSQRIKKSAARNQAANQRPATVNVNNAIGSRDDAYTPSGGRLMPFGEESEYWAGMPEATPEEQLI